MKTRELKLTQKELEKLILLIEDKNRNKVMPYPTEVLYHKLLNSALEYERVKFSKII